MEILDSDWLKFVHLLRNILQYAKFSNFKREHLTFAFWNLFSPPPPFKPHLKIFYAPRLKIMRICCIARYYVKNTFAGGGGGGDYMLTKREGDKIGIA